MKKSVNTLNNINYKLNNHKKSMKNLSLILLLIFLFISCKGHGQNKIDLKIPNNLVVKPTQKSQRLIGTKIFVDKPEGYEYVKSLVRLQKNDKTLIQFLEAPNVSFQERKVVLKKAFDNVIAKGASIYYNKEFKLSNYDAILIFAPSDKKSIDQIVMAFGNKEFTTIVSCELETNDKISRNEIVKCISSIYVDQSIKISPTELANYTINTSNTDFKFNNNTTQIFYYTIDGKGDPMNNVFQDHIMIMTLPTMNSFDRRKQYASNMINNYKNSGISIPQYKENEVMINNEKASEITFEGNFQGKQMNVYQIVIGDDKTTILFCGIAISNKDKFINQFKNIAKTLKINN